MSKHQKDTQAVLAETASIPTTALAVIGERFPVLNPETAAQFVAILRENLQGEDIGAFDLERIKVPTGGSPFWEVPSPESGEVEACKTFDGVVVAWKGTKTYWATAFGAGAGAPPDCQSDDGVTGNGAPGGACATCQFNQFGSKPATAENPDPKGKACRDQRLLFVLREGAMMPTLVSLPPSAIGVLKKYFLSLASRGLSYSAVVTRFALTLDKSSGGIGYSLPQLTMVERLAPENASAVRSYAAAIAPSLARVRDDESARESV